MEKLIITIAPTGSLPTKKNNPHVPISPDEIIQTGILCEKAGASIIHIHARNPVDETASTDFHIFRQIYQGLKKETNLILQISTGGRAGMEYEKRSKRLSLAPEMASLTTGSVNFPTSVYINSPDLICALAKDMKTYGIKPEIEVFDVSMVQNALDLADQGIMGKPLHFDFVMGLKGAIPATIENLVHLKNSIPKGSTWTVAGIGASQLPMSVHAINMGGHVRVGLEDCIYFSKGKLASNEQLVKRIAQISGILDREIATPDEARQILGLSLTPPT
ncbi:MAG: 3-keto-5-aminohexanoate cleavage protein [Desulfobacula sp.]|jgi:3-keto-5-aminohexanoate cleavage enzyme|uniref:3-keto-5-aminohexanoate cleavage protein n=1 Tax=Desulfobacula sp. TaxID=2593537 RepID=UPI001D1C56C0|nr:3-keto-5-aminohexanoate cleavage protein [Desulfobacula sp.]MBT3485152.1 3-keto-5-aminohexanoate cleavage protein [Desulfobacula sp.]MBT3804103.1 3-keto-5-aminohexanoate cleavage protein [Desulfobacula sp.]MBT4025356.1 3-keto-5-aminohexanoate cleavage protein [Desulfobacula sp.]MBT4199492.1 3-keto-5-aminohexanoate cleavage protein [Desulfobacula sp.]